MILDFTSLNIASGSFPVDERRNCCLHFLFYELNSPIWGNDQRRVNSNFLRSWEWQSTFLAIWKAAWYQSADVHYANFERNFYTKNLKPLTTWLFPSQKKGRSGAFKNLENRTKFIVQPLFEIFILYMFWLNVFIPKTSFMRTITIQYLLYCI
jgi:hypothetical protein